MDAVAQPRHSARRQRLDPVATEIVRNGLIAATEEMKTNLMRTAYNMIIYEALDFTVGLFDAQGHTISIGLGLPMFIRGMSDTVKTKLAHYGLGNLDPGDILLTNDAYITGSHLNHMTFTVPIFHDGEVVAIRVRVEVRGERMKVDLTDVARQVAGFYNSGETAGRSCCQVAFKCLTSPLDLPINDGQFRALEIVLPPGRVVSALKPAAMRLWMTYPMTIIDTIFKALAPAIPERIIAGHHADLVVGRVNGRRPKDDSFYIYLGGLIGGGWGAKHDSDGRNATIAMNDGDTHNGPSEQVEAKYPLLVERYALRPDSGGPGRFRGGLGCEQVVQARHELRFNSQMDRVKCKPWGLAGGLCGAGNSVAIHRFAAAQEQRFHNGKALNQVLHAGDAYILRSGGGGGFGSPLDRDLESLAGDVR